ncbi:hypothetical protein [Amaricoccus macauensis]|uniref:hypothetical protein n=1 Tax=Amaricoccus macauensis TaxID=57001 RepID=UPI003C7ABFA5
MTGTDPHLRHEFRVFGGDLRATLDTLGNTAPFGPEEAREDLYLVIRNRPDCGLKFRGTGNRLELKRLIRTERGCELWEPAASEDLPLTGAELSERFLAPAGLPPLPSNTRFDRTGLLNALATARDLRAIAVAKRRRQCSIGPVSCEHGSFAFPGGLIETGLALESTDLDRLCALISRLGLETRENVSLPRRLLRLSFAHA